MIKKRKSRILIFIVCFCFVSLGIASLLYFMSKYLVFFYAPSQIDKVENINKKFRLGGIVKSYTGDGKITKFYISDSWDCEFSIQVSFQGELPFMFGINQGVVVEGYLENGIFLASRLFIKHGETYIPKAN